jgi:hypothetical protein
MQHQSRSITDDITVPALGAETPSPWPTPVPRRRLLRALSGLALVVVTLVGLTGCGGEDGDGDEEDDD